MNKAYSRINWENYPSGETPINEINLNKVDSATDELDNRVIILDTTKLDKTTANTMVKDIAFDESTGTFTITKLNGSILTINTSIEKIATSFRYDYASQQLILTLIDGTTQEIDLSALLTQYEFVDGDIIMFSIDASGKVSASIKNGSVTEDKLQPNFLADIKVESAKAENSANSASVSEANAKNYMEQTKDVYNSISSSGDVLGVKGNKETSYRAGLVNLTAENIGAMKETVGFPTNELETEWKYITGSENIGHLNVLGYGNGKYVGHVGNAFSYSDDGFTWSKGTGAIETIESIAYGNGVFVAVGYDGAYPNWIPVAYYSNDGITWTKTTIGSMALNDIAFGNGMFIAVGNNGTDGIMLRSLDGTNWRTVIQADTYSCGTLNSVAFGNGKFVAVSLGSGYNVETYDGEHYSTTNTTSLYGIEYGNGVFVAKDSTSQTNSGNLWYSNSGDIWSKCNTPNPHVLMNLDIVFGNNTFLTGTDDGVWLKSSNGLDWEEVIMSYDETYPSMDAITYGDGKFISNGYNENGNSCLVYLEFKKQEVDAETVILEAKAKADAALQKENISNSTAITEKGQYALDAIEKNASVEGTLANQIANVDVPVLIKEFTVSDAVNSAITAFTGQAIRHGRKIIIDCSFATTSTGAIWLAGTNALPSASKMYTQLYPHASVTREVAGDAIHHVGIARIQNGGIVVNVTAGEKYVFHLEYVID